MVAAEGMGVGEGLVQREVGGGREVDFDAGGAGGGENLRRCHGQREDVCCVCWEDELGRRREEWRGNLGMYRRR